MILFFFSFTELAREDSVKALTYLQTTLHGAIDHAQPSEVQEFQALAATLFQPPDPAQSLVPYYRSPSNPQSDLESANEQSRMSFTESSELSSSSTDSKKFQNNPSECLTLLEPHELESWRHFTRSQLFERLIQFFPETMTQPRKNLVDLI